MRKTLLACGIVSSLLYAAMNVFVAAQWSAYSSISQTVSELSAIDSPTRGLWVPLGFVWGALLLAFGYGVWLTATAGPPRLTEGSAEPAPRTNSRPLQIAAALLMIYAAFGFFWPPMHLRPVLAAGGGTLTDTLHIVWTAISAVLVMLAMGFAAAFFGTPFRVYSIVTIVAMFALGWLTGTYAPAIQANLPTPWVGVWERVLIAFEMLWFMALAAMLLRAPRAASTPHRREAFAA